MKFWIDELKKMDAYKMHALSYEERVTTLATNMAKLHWNNANKKAGHSGRLSFDMFGNT